VVDRDVRIVTILWKYYLWLAGGQEEEDNKWVLGCWRGAGLTGLEHLCEDLETYVCELWRREVVSALG
jgi:hypothetical protein